MNLSSRSRYGIRALIDLAVNARESCIQLGDIAVRNDISVKYLEQIFMSLRKGGMIRSIKGPQGGYLLARTPEEMSQFLEHLTLQTLVEAYEQELASSQDMYYI